MGLCSSNNKQKKPIQLSQLIVSQPDQTTFKLSETQLTKQTKTAIPSIVVLQNPNIVREDLDPPTPQSFRHSFNIILCNHITFTIPEIQKSLEFKTGFFKTYSVIKKNQDENTLFCQHNKTAELVLVYCLDPNNIQDQYTQILLKYQINDSQLSIIYQINKRKLKCKLKQYFRNLIIYVNLLRYLMKIKHYTQYTVILYIYI